MDIGRDHIRRQLPPYNADEEESTARHELPAPKTPSVHVHLHSEHELDVGELQAVKPSLTKVLVAGAGILASAIVAYVASRMGVK